MTTNENLSYEDRKKWFRYHMHNSKISEENAWKQMNEMIRILLKKEYSEQEEEESYPEGVIPFKQSPIKKVIEKIWAENEDMFDRVWLEDEGSKIMYLDYNSGMGKIYENLDETNNYLFDVRYQKVNKVTAETEKI